jgi:hypothetical protein
VNRCPAHVIDGGQDWGVDFRDRRIWWDCSSFNLRSGGNDDKFGDWAVRMDNGRELSHYATMAVQNYAQKRRSNWYCPLLVGATPSLVVTA